MIARILDFVKGRLIIISIVIGLSLVGLCGVQTYRLDNAQTELGRVETKLEQSTAALGYVRSQLIQNLEDSISVQTRFKRVEKEFITRKGQLEIRLSERAMEEEIDNIEAESGETLTVLERDSVKGDIYSEEFAETMRKLSCVTGVERC